MAISRRTGSARSVGKRRILKLYATSTTGVSIAARSVAGARMDALSKGLTLTGAFGKSSDTILNRRDGSLADYTAAAQAQAPAGGGGGGGQQQPNPNVAPQQPAGNPLDLGAGNAAAVAAADLAGLNGPPIITATPNTAWTTGQFVTTQDGQDAHWDGTAWVANAAADAPDTAEDATVTIEPDPAPPPAPARKRKAPAKRAPKKRQRK